MRPPADLTPDIRLEQFCDRRGQGRSKPKRILLSPCLAGAALTGWTALQGQAPGAGLVHSVVPQRPEQVEAPAEVPVAAPGRLQRRQQTRAPLWTPRHVHAAGGAGGEPRTGAARSERAAGSDGASSRSQLGSNSTGSAAESQAPFNSQISSGVFMLPVREVAEAPLASPGMGSFSLVSLPKVKQRVTKSAERAGAARERYVLPLVINCLGTLC